MSLRDTLIAKREEKLAEAKAIVEVAEVEARDITAEELEAVKAARSEVDGLDARIAEMDELAKREASAPVSTPKVGGAVVTSEPRTYTPESGASFIRDAFTSQITGDFTASERLARHMREEAVERRDVGTANFVGLVIPQYLTDLAAPYARAGRPTADFATSKHALPNAGMKLEISRMTTGTSVDVQETQNTAVSETDADDTLLTVDVRTIAGQQDLSRQVIERGTGVDEFVVRDLIRAWHTKLDQQILAGTGSNGQIKGIRAAGGNAITFTSTAPTVALLYPKLADALQQVQSNVFTTPTHWIMHPRRLAFLLAATDSSGRPLVVPTANGAMNAAAIGDGVAEYANSGYQLLGLPIISDANVGTTYGAATNQDEIYLVDAREMHLWEQAGAPFSLRFDATTPGSLTVKTVVYGYAAFTAERYEKAASIISGTGLTAPSF